MYSSTSHQLIKTLHSSVKGSSSFYCYTLLDSESLDRCIQKALSALYPPFQATSGTVLCQVLHVVESCFRGDGLRYLLHFLLPAKQFLQNLQQDACEQYCGLLFRHEGWPLCVHEKVVVQLCPLDQHLLHPGDFYLLVSPAAAPPRAHSSTYRSTGSRHVEQQEVSAIALRSLFTMAWLDSVNREREQRGVSRLERCLLSANGDVFRVPWEDLVYPQFISRPRTSPKEDEEDANSSRLDVKLPPSSTKTNHSPADSDDSEGEYVELTELPLPRFSPQKGSLTQSISLQLQARTSTTTHRPSAASHTPANTSAHSAAAHTPANTSAHSAKTASCPVTGLCLCWRHSDRIGTRATAGPASCSHGPSSAHPVASVLPVQIPQCAAELWSFVDRSGRALLTVCTRSSVWSDPSCDGTELLRLLLYYTSTLRKEVQALGLTVLVDARGAAPVPALLSALRSLGMCVCVCVCVVQVEVLSSLKSVQKHVELHQLPREFGGSFSFSQSNWLCFRSVTGISRLSHTTSGLTDLSLFLSQDAERLLSRYKAVMRSILEDSRLVQLQQEGGASLSLLRREESGISVTEEYQAEVEAVSCLYDQVDELLHRLVTLSNSRTQELNFIVNFRSLEQGFTEVSLSTLSMHSPV
uniref:Uncharacterized protein n=1 Tax=Monopterus albus TaxID=43700 RepID=A0A3Q3JKZ7_MONAL